MSTSPMVAVDLTVWQLTDDGDEVPIRTTLRYHLSDPYAVHVTFGWDLEALVPWVFARELLVKGIAGSAGQGDVRVWRSFALDWLDDVYLGLFEAGKKAVLLVPGDELVAFLNKTYVLCPVGDEHEHVDTDLLIESLLAS